MFEVIYWNNVTKGFNVIKRFNNLNKAFHFLVAEGWEWDDKARVRKVSV
jgi:predicted phosphatase